MQTIQQITAELKAKIALHSGTPEEIEQARRNAMQRNLDCRVDCPDCGGIGYVKNDHGKVVKCPNVSGWTRFRGERYGLSDAERGLSWEKVITQEGTEAALAAIQQALARGAGWVYLWGPPGLAKTLILKTAVARALESCREAAYTRMAGILDNMRAAFDTGSPSYESQRRLDWWAGLPLLAIDEFDRLRATDYVAERRFLLMDRRYENALRAGANGHAYGTAGSGGPSGNIAAGKPAYATAERSGACKPAYAAAEQSGSDRYLYNPAFCDGSITLLAGNEDPSLLDGYLYDRIRDGRFSVVHLTGGSLRPAMEWG